MGAGTQTLLGHRTLQQTFAIVTGFAIGADLTRRHLSVAIGFLLTLCEAAQLCLASANNSLANLPRCLGDARRTHLFVVHCGNIDVNIDAIHQRAGDLRNVTLDHWRSAAALPRAVIMKAAGTRIHRRGEHKPGRESKRHGGPRHTHGAIFQRLAHDLQYVAWKLRKFVEEKHTVVRQRDFSGPRGQSHRR